jgi:hypothetical protein
MTKEFVSEGPPKSIVCQARVGMEELGTPNDTPILVHFLRAGFDAKGCGTGEFAHSCKVLTESASIRKDLTLSNQFAIRSAPSACYP